MPGALEPLGQARVGLDPVAAEQQRSAYRGAPEGSRLRDRARQARLPSRRSSRKPPTARLPSGWGGGSVEVGALGEVVGIDVGVEARERAQLAQQALAARIDGPEHQLVDPGALRWRRLGRDEATEADPDRDQPLGRRSALAARRRRRRPPSSRPRLPAVARRAGALTGRGQVDPKRRRPAAARLCAQTRRLRYEHMSSQPNGGTSSTAAPAGVAGRVVDQPEDDAAAAGDADRPLARDRSSSRRGRGADAAARLSAVSATSATAALVVARAQRDAARAARLDREGVVGRERGPARGCARRRRTLAS